MCVWRQVMTNNLWLLHQRAQCYSDPQYIYLLPRNGSSYPRRLDLLQCHFNCFTPTNKIWVRSVYVVHLYKRTTHNCSQLKNVRITNNLTEQANMHRNTLNTKGVWLKKKTGKQLSFIRKFSFFQGKFLLLLPQRIRFHGKK